MAADGGVASPIDRAWGYIPQDAEKAGRGTFTRRRIDRIAAISAGVGSSVLGLQAFVIALANDGGIHEPWGLPVIGVVFGALLLMCIACLFERTSKPATAAFALIYVVVLLLWPVLTAAATPSATPEPWLWYLVNVATMAAVIAFPFPLQVTYTVAVPLLYGVVRLAQGGFAPEFWAAFVFEVPYSLILGSLLLVLAQIFRRMGSGVDRARASAVSSYAKAAEAQAAHEERVAVSALMHDSVLAALIAAERADSPRARSLAVSMAREALEGLAETGGPSADLQAMPMTLKQLGRGVQTALADLGVRLDVAVDDAGDAAAVPGPVAVALIRAATQAIANAVQHADGRGLRAHVGRPEGGDPAASSVEVVVSDEGPGFDVDAVPDDRLGISASILARVSAVGGTADIASGPRGTVVTLRWTAA